MVTPLVPQGYNFREYFVRRVKEDFRAQCGQKDLQKFTEFITKQRANLRMMERQGLINSIYTESEQVRGFALCPPT